MNKKRRNLLSCEIQLTLYVALFVRYRGPMKYFWFYDLIFVSFKHNEITIKWFILFATYPQVANLLETLSWKEFPPQTMRKPIALLWAGMFDKSNHHTYSEKIWRVSWVSISQTRAPYEKNNWMENVGVEKALKNHLVIFNSFSQKKTNSKWHARLLLFLHFSTFLLFT